MGKFRVCPVPINTESVKSSVQATASQTNLTHYCIVRRDLSIGLQAANLVHAAGESSPGKLPQGTFAVALTITNETALRELHERLAAACIPHATITESDGEHAGQLMAIGVVPGDRAHLRRHFSSLPLLKRAPCRCEDA